MGLVALVLIGTVGGGSGSSPLNAALSPPSTPLLESVHPSGGAPSSTPPLTPAAPKTEPQEASAPPPANVQGVALPLTDQIALALPETALTPPASRPLPEAVNGTVTDEGDDAMFVDSRKDAEDDRLREAYDQLQRHAWTSALALYDRVLAQNPDHETAWQGRLYALEHARTSAALHRLQALSRAFPEKAPVWASLARVLAERDEAFASLRAWRRADELAPDTPAFSLGRAVMADQLGLGAEALTTYRRLPLPWPDDVARRVERLSATAPEDHEAPVDERLLNPFPSDDRQSQQERDASYEDDEEPSPQR